MIIKSERLVLRPWLEADRDAFIALHSDPEVMADYGGLVDLPGLDEKFDRYRAAFERLVYGRWLLERDGEMVGYTGLMAWTESHALGAHVDIGWRLVRKAWGKGYATEAARAALDDGFARCGLTEVLAYTAADNLRSRSVMDRLGLQREPGRDFEAHYDGVGLWRGMVWSAKAGER